MANVSISAGLYPYRMSLRQHSKMAAELTVEISNNDSAPKQIVMDLELPEQVALDKSGINRIISRTVKDLPPGKTAGFKFPIFLTHRADLGVFSGKLLVSEHAKDFEYATTNYSKEVSFRVID